MRFTMLLFAAAFSYTAHAAETPSRLTIYAYSPSARLDWTTPKSLVSDFIDLSSKALITEDHAVDVTNDFGDKVTLSSHYVSPMGHTIARVQCRLSNGRWYDHWSSLTGMNDTNLVIDKVVDKGEGAGVVLYDYKDGLILTGEENWKRLTHYYGVTQQNGRTVRKQPRYIEFQIDTAACDRIHHMTSFYESFHYSPDTPYAELDARNPEDVVYFTPSFLPYESYMHRMQTGRGKVGGGCAGYGAGLVKAAQRYDEQFDSWMRPITVSEKLIGGTIDERGHERRVSLSSILWGSLGRNWTYKNVENREIDLYDPALIWNFIGKAMSCINGQSCDGEVAKWLNAKGAKVRRGRAQFFSNKVNNPKPGNPVKSSQTIEGIVVAK